jgi:hypothetical protein
MGYYMDADGAVWSTRKGGILTPIKGSNIKGPRSPATVSLQYNGSSRRYLLAELQGQAFGHWSFEQNTGHVDLATALGIKAKAVDAFAMKADQYLAKLSYARLLKEGLAARGWIIGSVTEQGLSFAAAPVVHKVEAEATAEMARLAKLKPGTQFVRLQLVDSVTYTQPKQESGFKWE